MSKMSTDDAHQHHQRWILQSLTISNRAVVHGNHPFGALLVSHDGKVLHEAENAVLTTKDATMHAETRLVSEVSNS
jgi:tRNA(Arg) A34 adenosine deaminase TadA